MVIRTSYETQVSAPPASDAFATAITSQPILLNNGKVLDILLGFGAGDAATLSATMTAQHGVNGTPQPIPFFVKAPGATDFVLQPKEGGTIPIGGENAGVATVRVTADMLSSIDADRVVFQTTALSGSTLAGAVLALLFDPRYSY